MELHPRKPRRHGSRNPAIDCARPGVRPRYRRGIKVDDHMVTSNPHILAVASASSTSPVYGWWRRYGTCAAPSLMVSSATFRYRGSVTSTKSRCRDRVFSAVTSLRGRGEDIVLRMPARHLQARHREGRSHRRGSSLWRHGDGGWYFDLLKKREDISCIRDLLIFGQAFASGGQADPRRRAALSEDAEVCGCNGVSKGVSLLHAAARSVSCRSRRLQASALWFLHRLVESLLALELADEVQSGPKTMCIAPLRP